MKRRIQLLFAVLLSVIISVTPAVSAIENPVIFSAMAHSGRTDSSGGHKDNKNKSGLGSYHYHCGGNPPHLHTNGACPYQSSSTTSTSTKTSSTTKEHSEKVKAVQTALNEKGYDCGTPDGIMGGATRNALIKFQEDHSLTADGIIGSQVLNALGINLEE